MITGNRKGKYTMVKLIKFKRTIAFSVICMLFIACCPNLVLAGEVEDATSVEALENSQPQSEDSSKEKLSEEFEALQGDLYVNTDNIVELAGIQAQTPPSIIKENFDASEIRKTSQGLGSITVKTVIHILKKYKTKVIKTVKKVNKSWGEKLEKNYSKLLSYLDTLKGSVEAVLTKALIKIGLSESAAEVVADIIITIASWVI